MSITTKAPGIETAPAAHRPTLANRIVSNQAFWVTIAVFLIPIAMTAIEPSFRTSFWKEENFFNVTRNFAFIAIMALGQVAVMITGGIDLAVGSTLAVCGIVLGLLMSEGYSRSEERRVGKECRSRWS